MNTPQFDQCRQPEKDEPVKPLTKIGKIVIKKAVAAAVEKGEDDFFVSPVFWLQDYENSSRTLEEIPRALMLHGVMSDCYVEQADIGNGLQDLSRPRVHIHERDGQHTDAPRRKRTLGHSCIAILSTCEKLENTIE